MGKPSTCDPSMRGGDEGVGGSILVDHFEQQEQRESESRGEDTFHDIKKTEEVSSIRRRSRKEKE